MDGNTATERIECEIGGFIHVTQAETMFKLI